MTQAYTFDTNIDVAKIGNSGYGRVTGKIHGYWSHDSITLYIQRDTFGSKKWRVTLSHSTGGRDTKEVASDLDAEINFGQALIAMAQFGKEVEQRFEELESFYQARLEADRIARKAAEEATRAKIEADTPLGIRAAEVMIALALCGKVINVYKRGDTDPEPLTARMRAKTSFYFCGMRMAKKKVLDILANSSNRTAVVK